MKRALLFWGLIFIAATAGCIGASTPPWDNPDNRDPPADLTNWGPAPEPRWADATSYLGALFDAQRSLCRQSPGALGFWSINDNALTARAFGYLPMVTAPTGPDPMYGALITTRLQTLKACGCNDQPEHDGFVDHHSDPVVNKGGLIPFLPRTACVRSARLVPAAQSTCIAAGSQCPSPDFQLRHEESPLNGWIMDSCQVGPCSTMLVAGWDEEGVGVGDADFLALQILSRKNQGSDTAALWQNLLGKWDGKGMLDRAAVAEQRYQTYKLALLKICARVLGKPLPPGVDNQLAAAQNEKGGFRATYAADGKFTLDQLGDIKTTAYVVLAYRKPTADF